MLKGSKIVLREKRIEDAAKDYSWRADPELARLDATSRITISLQEYTASYAQELRYPSPRRRRFAIEDLDGKHIGNCSYYEIDELKGEAELGIMIGDRSYWDGGYGSDAVATLVRHVFGETRLNRIYLHTLDWNVRARRCFEKSGFVSCNRVIRGGHNFVLMEIRRSWLEEETHQAPPGEK